MVEDNDNDGNPIDRRQVLKKTAITGATAWGVTGTGSAGKSASNGSAVSSVEALLDSEAVRSIESAVPNFQARPRNARVTGAAERGNGQTIEVPARPGTLYVSELPDGAVVAVLRFPNDVPRRELNVDATVPEGAKAMLLGSGDGARLLRSASPEEREAISESIGLSDEENVHISTTSGSDVFEVSKLDLEAETVKLTKVRPVDENAEVGAASSAANFEVVSETVVSPGADSTDTVSAQSCDCGELAASIVLCLSTLSACESALSCSPFGPKAVIACSPVQSPVAVSTVLSGKCSTRPVRDVSIWAKISGTCVLRSASTRRPIAVDRRSVT